jgi:hypothetical protein
MFRDIHTSSNSISSQEAATGNTGFGPIIAPAKTARWGFTASDGRGNEARITNTRGMTERDTRVEKRLLLAVVVRTIREWVSGHLRYKRLAEEYLF